MANLAWEVRLALRRLRAAPAFTTFAIVTLALGIGATTAIYSVVYSVLLKPPAIENVDEVVNLYHWDPSRGSSIPRIAFSWPDFEDLGRQQTSFSEIAGWAFFRHTLVANGWAETMWGEMVGGTFFRLTRLQPAAGRLIQPADDRPGAPPVIVLGEALWRRRFDADPAVIGRTVLVGGHRFEVVGVAPASFRGNHVPEIMPKAFWVPLAAQSLIGSRGAEAMSDRESRWVMVKARLRAGVTAASALAELRGIGAQLDAVFPLGREEAARSIEALRRTPQGGRHWHLIPAADVRLIEGADRFAVPIAAITLGAVTLVLLVACTNLANLLLARGASRRQETAIRLALGASRAMLVREYLVEHALLALAGGAAAMLVARVLMVDVLSANVYLLPGATLQLTPEMHPSVLGVAIGATFLCLGVFGLIPTLHVTRADLRGVLESDSGTTIVSRWRGRRNLIAAQVAVSVALAGAVAVCIQQIAASSSRNVGFDLERLALLRFDFGLQRYEEARARALLDAIAESARMSPGVTAVAVASGIPLGDSMRNAYLTNPDASLAGRQFHDAGELMTATPSIFEAMGVRILRGRPLDQRDTREAPPVAVIDETIARAVFNSFEVLGRQMLVRPQRRVGEEEPLLVVRTIVGIAEGVDTGSVGRREHGVVYVPFAQHYEADMTVIARTTNDPAPAVGALRAIAARLDPQLAILDAGTGPVLSGATNLPLKIAAATAGLLGGLALLLAMVGLYGVLSHLVARRTRELGIRMALGAERRHVFRMVLVDGLRPACEGLIIGLMLGAIVRMALRPLFVRGLPELNPLTIAAIPVLFLLAALIACYFPARRAVRVDPNVALREL